MRVERFGNATLYLGDSREIMPSLSADVIVTDPVWPNCPPGLIQGWENPYALWGQAMHARPAMVQRVITVLRNDSDPSFFAHGPLGMPFFRVIILPYALPSYIGRALGGDELAYWHGTAPPVAPGRRLIPGRAPIAQPTPRNGHPCSRSQTHFDWLVSWATEAGQTVLDPFMGSATTGIASIRAGLPFIGIEVDPPHFDLACRRIEACMRWPRLPLQETAHA